MPGLNRKGPQGEGPMTGKRMGRCNPDNKGKTDDEILQNKDSSLEPSRGLGCGLGLGRGQGGSGRGLVRRNRFRGGI